MSGGALNYAYYQLEALAEEIAEKLKNNEVQFGNGLTKMEQQEVIAEINNLIADLGSASARVKNLEWWLSGDFGEKDYLDTINQKTI